MTDGWYLHDKRVKLVGKSVFGLKLKDDLGETQWVFTTGQRVYECLGRVSRSMPDRLLSCPNCSWERLVYQCGNSCDGYITKGGCR